MCTSTRLLVLFSVALAASPAQGSGAGIVGYSGSGGLICTVCHTPTGAAPTVVINGPASLGAGQSGDYTLTVSGGPGTRAGVNIGASAGALAPGGPELVATAGELHHLASLPYSAGQAVFRFRVTAPGAGASFQLFAAGNSTNGVGLVGDNAAGVVRTISVAAPANTPPSVTAGPTANPATVTGTTTALTVGAADDGGEPNLVYVWTAVSAPAPVSFSPNNNNAAKSTTATFTRAGTYPLRVTVRDAAGNTAVRDLSVTVNQRLESLTLSPATVGVPPSGSVAFTPTGRDQFSQSFLPTLTWTVAGGGTVTNTCVFTAGATPGGPFTVTAAGGGQSATAQVSVLAGSPPTLTAGPTATPATVTGTTGTLTVGADDDGGEANLVYVWTAVSPPAPVSFSPNNNNAAKSTTVTFSRAGTYTFQLTVRDRVSLSAQAELVVPVTATLTTLTVSPATTTVARNGGEQGFTVGGRDQFDTPLAPAPAVTWQVSGGGSINDAGLFRAGPAAGGPHTVTASHASGKTAQAQVTIAEGDAPSVAQEPTAQPSNVVGKSTVLRVLGADDGGEAALTYTWSLKSGPADVSFSANGSNDTKSTTVTFAEGGSYEFSVQLTDLEGKSATASVAVNVERTVSAVAVTPDVVAVEPAQSQRFQVGVRDQFGLQLTPAPLADWTVSGGGSIDADGLFTAGATRGGPFTVSAGVGGIRGTARLTVGSLASDVVAPVVTLRPPAQPGPVRGEIPLEADAEDDVGVLEVVFYLGDLAIGRLTAAPWSMSFDTRTVENGRYQLKVLARDGAGNVSHSEPLDLQVENPAPGTRPAEVAGAVGCGAQVTGASASGGASLLAPLTLLLAAVARRRRKSRRAHRRHEVVSNVAPSCSSEVPTHRS